MSALKGATALPMPPPGHVASIQFRMEELFKLWRTTCHLGTADIERLNVLLGKLSASDLKAVAAFAEGLAEWSSGASG